MDRGVVDSCEAVNALEILSEEILEGVYEGRDIEYIAGRKPIDEIIVQGLGRVFIAAKNGHAMRTY